MMIYPPKRDSVWLYMYNNLHVQLNVEFFDADFFAAFKSWI